MGKWLTPDAVEGAALCRPLNVPPQYLHLVSGCLELLSESWNWEQFGDVPVSTVIADMRTMIDDYYLGDCAMATPAPETALLLWDQGQIIAGGALIATFDAAQPMGLEWRQSPAVLDDKIGFRVSLAEGTYEVRLMCQQRSSSGIATVVLDDMEVDTIDLYNGTTQSNRNVLGEIVVAEGGVHQLDFYMHTKNASSSGYRADVTYIAIRRTGD